jgi:hypothetical protein
MWPDLFGAGSELGLLVAGSTLAGLGALVWFAVRNARPMPPDPVADLWRRYEQGELTTWEAARLFRILAGQQAAAEELARPTAPAYTKRPGGAGYSVPAR